MIKITVWLSSFLACVVVQAADFGMEVGFRQQSGDYTTAYSTNSVIGAQLGAVGQFALDGPLAIRSGLLYTQRPLEIKQKATGSTAKLNMTYFDIPVGLLYKFESYGGIFVGTGVSLLLEKSCTGITGCEVDSAKSMVIPFQIGGTFKFAPQMGATIYYEMIGDDVAKDQSNYRAIGLNLLITFD